MVVKRRKNEMLRGGGAGFGPPGYTMGTLLLSRAQILTDRTKESARSARFAVLFLCRRASEGELGDQ